MIYTQSVFDTWPIESESVQSLITSPPYYALRKYAIPDVIIGGGKYLFCPNCEISVLWNSNIVDSKCSFCNKFKLITVNCKHEFGKETIERKRGNVSGITAQCGVQKAGTCGTHVNHGSFCINCNAWKGQYGLEPTPQMYVDHTRLWAKEVWRVLRDDGVFFLNIADSYAGSGGAGGDYNKAGLREGQPKYKQSKINYPSKCQLLIPHRVAISLIDDGWILRNTVIWTKPNAMPESVTDRFSKKYEYIFMFTKNEKYYFDLDSIRESQSESSKKRAEFAIRTNETYENRKDVKFGHEYINSSPTRLGRKNMHSNILSQGKNPGDVWVIPTQPSPEKHFAMWPERLVERMVKCGTKAGDTILDPFAGSGTTLKVAKQMNRKALGIDLGYQEIQERRLSKIQKMLFV